MYRSPCPVGIQECKKAHENDGADHAAQAALHRLPGADGGRQLMGAEGFADEIRRHIIDRAAQYDKNQNGKPPGPLPNLHRAVKKYGKHQRTGQNAPKADGMDIFPMAHKQGEGHNRKNPRD